MLELIRKQRYEQRIAAGAEEEKNYFSSTMFRAQSRRLTEEQRYAERITHSIPFPEMKKISYFKNHMGDCKKKKK